MSPNLSEVLAVLPLQWAEASGDEDFHSGAWVAAGIAGFYRIERRESKGLIRFVGWRPLQGYGEDFASFEAAAAGAQAHFAERLRECLSVLPDTAPTTKEGGQARVPDGWLLVPEHEATDEMIAAFFGAVTVTREGAILGFNSGYRGMLSALPTLPDVQKGETP